jgi:hypothetical protein
MCDADDFFGGLGFADIAGDGDRGAAGVRDRSDTFGQYVGLPAVDDDVRTRCREHVRDGGSDPTRSAGDDNDPVGEIERDGTVVGALRGRLRLRREGWLGRHGRPLD